MKKVIITKKDECFMYIEADQDFLMKVFHEYSYYVEGYKFQPKYKMGIWDGKIKLFRFITRELPLGFLKQLKYFCKDQRYEYELVGFEEYPLIDDEYVEEFISSLHLPPEYEVRDYQKELFKEAINQRRMVGVASTSSGKSLSQYLLALHNLKVNKSRVLIIVPTTALVLQMIQDFKEYGLEQEGFSIFGIKGGVKKIYEDDIIVSTWQSIYKEENHEDLAKAEFGMVLVDETHKAKDGAKISDIMFALPETKYRIGVTGSLPKNHLERQQIIGVLGEPHNIIKAQELITRGMATKLDITSIFLEYPQEEREYIKAVKNWHKETNFINSHIRKQNFIVKLAMSQINLGHNGIIFFNRNQFGKDLFEKLKEKHDKVYYIDGSSSAEFRNEIRSIFENEDKVLLVASMKVFSTGINIKKLHFGIFGESPGKSFITLIQSLGRFLRVHDSKKSSKIFDLVDDFRVKSFLNYSYRHFIERLNHYREEGYLVKEKHYQI